MAARYLSTIAFLSRELATKILRIYHSRFSNAPQVVGEGYPEYVMMTQKPFSTSSEQLGGMKPVKFWLLITVAAVIIITASVGGDVGGVAAVRKSQAKAETAISRYLGSHYMA